MYRILGDTGRGAQEVLDAINGAMDYEDFDAIETIPEGADEMEFADKQEMCTARYKGALQRLKAVFPGERCDWRLDGFLPQAHHAMCLWEWEGMCGLWPWERHSTGILRASVIAGAP